MRLFVCQAPKVAPYSVKSALDGAKSFLSHPHKVFAASTIGSNALRNLCKAAFNWTKFPETPLKYPVKSVFIGAQNLYISPKAVAIPSKAAVAPPIPAKLSGLVKNVNMGVKLELNLGIFAKNFPILPKLSPTTPIVLVTATIEVRALPIPTKVVPIPTRVTASVFASSIHCLIFLSFLGSLSHSLSLSNLSMALSKSSSSLMCSEIFLPIVEIEVSIPPWRVSHFMAPVLMMFLIDSSMPF